MDMRVSKNRNGPLIPICGQSIIGHKQTVGIFGCVFAEKPKQYFYDWSV